MTKMATKPTYGKNQKADCAMLEMSWITVILQLYSKVTDLFGNVIVKRINIRLFDLLALFHYILNPPRKP